MAAALECPACGERHRLDTLPDTATFRCERCGQVLKVPPHAPRRGSAPGGAAPPPRRDANSPVAPPPRRRSPGSAAPTVAAAGVTATVAANEPPLPPNGARAPEAAPRPRRKRVAWYWRLVAWIVAVPLGFVVTVWPAYKWFDFIRKDDVLNVFVGSGLGRYARFAIVTAIWALVTAVLVQLFVEGGRWLAARRRARRPKSPPGKPDSSRSTPPLPPSRPTASARR